jgi:hypothetical protein
MADCHGRLDAREGGTKLHLQSQRMRAEGRPQRWGYTERAAIFNMHARVAMLQAIHHGQPEPG